MSVSRVVFRGGVDTGRASAARSTGGRCGDATGRVTVLCGAREGVWGDMMVEFQLYGVVRVMCMTV